MYHGGQLKVRRSKKVIDLVHYFARVQNCKTNETLKMIDSNHPFHLLN